LLKLDKSPDPAIWEYARENGFIIVTRDADFSDMSVMKGFPPKVIWVRRGNCAAGEIESILRLNYDAVESLAQDGSLGLLTLF